MPEPLPNLPKKEKSYSDFQIIFFIILLCLICGFLLATVSFSLQIPQNEAKEFDQSKQMLIAAKILNHSGSFQILKPEGQLIPATLDRQSKTLIPFIGKGTPKATEDEIKEIAALRIHPLLTDREGNIFTLEEKKITLSQYLSENKKAGYAQLPFKLFYAILPNLPDAETISAEEIAKDIHKANIYVIPISGFGLWAPIYGYLAISSDGAQVIGTTWYEHAETPGLGANITEAWWQKQFYGKEIFQQSPEGTTDFQTSPLGIIVVKGKVKDVYGTSPKSKSAVDGMSGATLTGDGVTQAYRNSLTPYRPFLLKVHETSEKSTPTDESKQ